MSCLEEELPVTMQVGMVGSDGVLIASDTKWADESSPVRHTWNHTKFKINRDGGVVVACAGKLVTAGYLADEIIEATVRNEDWMAVDLGAKQKIEDKVLSLAQKGSEWCQCQVAFMRPTIKLYCFQIAMIGQKWSLDIAEVLSKKCTGDYKNSAIFWAERYYPRLTKLPVKRLVALAAHQICAARCLNSGGIDGLEIVLCDTSGIYRLSDEELIHLETRSIEHDQRIGVNLLGETHQG